MSLEDVSYGGPKDDGTGVMQEANQGRISDCGLGNSFTEGKEEKTRINPDERQLRNGTGEEVQSSMSKVQSPEEGSPPPYVGGYGGFGYGVGGYRFGVGAVEPWPEAVDGARLLEELRQIMRRYVVLPAHVPETLALWILHTYAWELRKVTTYIGVSSPEKRCGKTTLLEVLSEVVNRPVVAANISPPALFRVIEEARPTLLIDEADTFLQGNEELRGILNAGYSRKTAYVVRVGPLRNSFSEGNEEKPQTNTDEQGVGEGNPPPHVGGYGRGESGLVRFSCWCPKVMAAIGRLPETLADRCITVSMQRKTAEEECERLRDLDGSEMRRKCARFVIDHAAEIAAARPEIPKSLNDRAADIWETLLALADLAGGEWPKLARDAAEHLSAKGRENNALSSLLFDVLVAFVQLGGEKAHSHDLVTQLNFRTGRAWQELLKGRPATEVWLSQQLRPYGVRPRSIWINGVSRKGYMKEDFGDIFKRYIPKAEAQELFEELRRPDQEEEVNSKQ